VIRRIGVDTCGVERMAIAVRRSGERFLRRAFTDAELDYCRGRVERLAGRWAAKEAVIKCFDGTPICFPRRRIEVLAEPSGAPRVRLLAGDVRRAQVQVSITHGAGIAIATAILEMPEAAEVPPPAPAAVRLPERPPDAHKGTFGTVLAVAGSLGFTGAAYLCSTAAARAGAGLVRLLVGRGIYPGVATKCTEVMATPVEEVAPGAVGQSAEAEIMRYLQTSSVGLVGPGLGGDPSTWRLVLDLVANVQQPLVLDADGLNALADSRDALPRVASRGPRVLTPHPGEMARLVDRRTAEVQAERVRWATTAARGWGAVVVLKGSHTVVAAPDGRLSEDPHEVPALATGGTGDVLAGVIAGLIAQGSEPFEAAVTGVYVHAEAGRRVASRLGDAGLLASDLLPELPLAMQAMRKGALAS
jgi:NAD(P)H-hydrate epimerase